MCRPCLIIIKSCYCDYRINQFSHVLAAWSAFRALFTCLDVLRAQRITGVFSKFPTNQQGQKIRSHWHVERILTAEPKIKVGLTLWKLGTAWAIFNLFEFSPNWLSGIRVTDLSQRGDMGRPSSISLSPYGKQVLHMVKRKWSDNPGLHGFVRHFGQVGFYMVGICFN